MEMVNTLYCMNHWTTLKVLLTNISMNLVLWFLIIINVFICDPLPGKGVFPRKNSKLS